MVNTFVERLCKRYDIPQADILELITRMSPKAYKKGDCIVENGKCNTDFYIIANGIWRASYINDNGDDVTLWFASQEECLFSSWGFVAGRRSMLKIEAMSESLLYSISKENLESFYMSSVNAARIGRRLLERQIFELDTWLMNSGAPRAKERYLTLLEDNPELLQHVPLKYIASYLWITPQSLSRIRAEIAHHK